MSCHVAIHCHSDVLKLIVKYTGNMSTEYLMAYKTVKGTIYNKNPRRNMSCTLNLMFMFLLEICGRAQQLTLHMKYKKFQ